MANEVTACPIPSLPHPIERLNQDRPTALDRLLVKRSTHFGLAVASFVGGAFVGLPPEVAALLSFVVSHVALIWALLLPRQHMARGHYRRTLFVAEQFEKRSCLSSAAASWRFLRSGCHLLLGDARTAQQIMASVPRERLSSRARWWMDLHRAILECQVMKPEAALAILDELEKPRMPQDMRPSYHMIRASALSLVEKFPESLAEIDQVEALGPPPLFAASCLGLRAFVKIEEQSDPGGALLLSRQALARIGDWYTGRPGLLLNHARIVLDATGNVQETLSILGTVIGHEAELGARGQAELHFLLARCYLAAGMVTTARIQLSNADDIPCPPRLKARIEELSLKLDGIRALPELA